MECKTIQLKEVLDYDQPNPYIVKSPIKKEKTNIPVLTANKGFIKGYTDDTEGIYENVPVIIFDDFTTNLKFVSFPFKVKSSAMKILKLKRADISLKYVYYQMASKKINSSTHKRYYISIYQKLDFIFPINKHKEIDLSKQELIVAEIETQFTRLDSAIKSMQIIKKKLEVYKNSILKTAFEGKLIETNIEWKKIGDFVDMTSGRAFKKSEYSKSGVRLFQIANVTFGKTIWKKIAYLPESYIHSNSNLSLKEDDVLMALNRPLLSHKLKIAILTKNDVPSILYQRVGRFDFLNNQVIKQFFFYYMRSPFFVKDLEKSLQGVNIPFINKSKLMSFKFPICEVQIQKKIVQEIESRFSIIDKLEETLNNSLLKAGTLRKSILKSAFEGKLVRYNNNE